MPKNNFIIAVSGGPATGKSTLVKKLAKHYRAKAFLEGEEKDFPRRIWRAIKSGKNQLELIIYFRNKYLKDHLQALKIKEMGGRAILDNFFLTNKVYIEQWMKDKFEKSLARDLTEIDFKILPLPDLLICLSCCGKKSLEFLAKRGRKNEKSAKVVKRYATINAAHDKIFKEFQIKNTIYIDRTDLDFEKKKDFQNLLDKINEKL